MLEVHRGKSSAPRTYMWPSWDRLCNVHGLVCCLSGRVMLLIVATRGIGIVYVSLIRWVLSVVLIVRAVANAYV